MKQTKEQKTVIKLIEGKDHDKTLLNTILSLEQTAYVEKRFIVERGGLISDILSVTNNLNMKSYLVTMDIEKSFDSLNHHFLISVFKNLDLGKISLIGSKYCYIKKKCVLNGGLATKYFNLDKGAHQSDLVSAYLLILALEFLFFYLSKMIPR